MNITDRHAALRKALSAGPTPGARRIRWVAGVPGSVVGGVERAFVNGRAQDQLFVVCHVQEENGGLPAMAANAQLAAAASPVALSALLAERDLLAALLGKLLDCESEDDLVAIRSEAAQVLGREQPADSFAQAS